MLGLVEKVDLQKVRFEEGCNRMKAAKKERIEYITAPSFLM